MNERCLKLFVSPQPVFSQLHQHNEVNFTGKLHSYAFNECVMRMFQASLKRDDSVFFVKEDFFIMWEQSTAASAVRKIV